VTLDGPPRRSAGSDSSAAEDVGGAIHGSFTVVRDLAAPPGRVFAAFQTSKTSWPAATHSRCVQHTNSAAVWPILTFGDARRAITFLNEAFGFEESAVFAREDDPSIVEHAEMRWPLGGGIMFGSAGKDDGPFGQRKPGTDSVYVVCDNPDRLFARATATGAQVVRGLADESYGSRGFTVRDPEGNLWSFGTYRGINHG
jgi:uncharacterized glyoxalase superfamily protein PhnB